MAEKAGERVLAFITQIPKGKVCTYGQIAKKFGTSPRAVGSIMHSNKNPVIVPCHRIVTSDGMLGGYSRGVGIKARLLRDEGIKITNGRIDLKKFGWAP